MSRELRFRAWNKDEGAMVYGVCSSEQENNSLILMQYTGLKDNKEEEVYEGDLAYSSCYGKYLMEVRWDGNLACFYLHDPSGYEEDHLSILDIVEVVGNIHEN